MPQQSSATRAPIEVCILAGGLSTRMGRDKARVRIGGQSMLSAVRQTAATLGFPVRTIRKDVVPRCGPIGGIITGFRRSRASALLFLACDMPFVDERLLRRVVARSASGTRPVFTSSEDGSGFPFLVPRAAVGVVEAQHAAYRFSLQQLAGALQAARVRGARRSVLNVNTPEEVARAANQARRGP